MVDTSNVYTVEAAASQVYNEQVHALTNLMFHRCSESFSFLCPFGGDLTTSATLTARPNIARVNTPPPLPMTRWTTYAILTTRTVAGTI